MVYGTPMYITMVLLYCSVDSDGNIIMEAGVEAKVHDMKVTVTDNSQNKPVVADIKITVVDVTEEMVQNSGSIRFEGMGLLCIVEIHFRWFARGIKPCL